MSGCPWRGYIALRALQRKPGTFSGGGPCAIPAVKPMMMPARSSAPNAAQSVKQDGSAAFCRRLSACRVSVPASINNNVPGVGLIKEIISNNDPLAIAGNLIAMAARTDTTASLKDIAVPTLILVGEEDNLTTPDDARNMQSHIQGGTAACGA